MSTKREVLNEVIRGDASPAPAVAFAELLIQHRYLRKVVEDTTRNLRKHAMEGGEGGWAIGTPDSASQGGAEGGFVDDDEAAAAAAAAVVSDRRCDPNAASVGKVGYRVRVQWQQLHSATGRLLTEDPNLQCLPKPVVIPGLAPLGVPLNPRRVLVAGPGHRLVAADYCQQEFRILAFLSADRRMLASFHGGRGGGGGGGAAAAAAATGGGDGGGGGGDDDDDDDGGGGRGPIDPFVYLARHVFGREASTRDRDVIKQLFYAIIYGMGVPGIAEALKCTEADAAEYLQAFSRALPDLDRWKQRVLAAWSGRGDRLPGVADVGVVHTFAKRLRRIPLDDRETKVLNSVIQGSAADLCKVAMIKLDKQLRSREGGLRGKCWMVLAVHDEVVVECEVGVVPQAVAALRAALTEAGRLECKRRRVRVPLEVKVRTGRSWGSLRPYEEEQTNERTNERRKDGRKES